MAACRFYQFDPAIFDFWAFRLYPQKNGGARTMLRNLEGRLQSGSEGSLGRIVVIAGKNGYDGMRLRLRYAHQR